jgi:hypothetical protein
MQSSGTDTLSFLKGSIWCCEIIEINTILYKIKILVEFISVLVSLFDKNIIHIHK